MKKWIAFTLTLMLSLSFCKNVFAHEYIMSYLFGGTTTQYNNYVTKTSDLLDTVSPDYFDINPNGSLNYQKIDPAFIQNMHNQNKEVTPFLSNHWDRELGIIALNNTESLTTEIANVINQYNLDGVNVDIENVSHLYKDQYTNFVKHLRDKMPNKKITVAVAANPHNWQIGWHGCYDYAALAKYSDYLMIMGYDESYYGGPAGPIAGKTFTEKSIQYALNHVSAHQIVLGIPFFGRYWKQGEAVGGNGITDLDIENLLEGYETTKTYHNDSQSVHVKLTLKEGEIMPKIWGGRTLTPGVYDIWYDDNTAKQYKLDLVNKYKLKGSGSWALGQDATDVWEYYAQYKTPSEPPTPQIPVTDVTLNKEDTTLIVGQSETLRAIVSPSNATNKAVTWKSSHPEVATVDANGKVTAKAVGKTVIIVRTNDGNKLAIAIVTVNPVKVTGVKLNKASTTIFVGKSETLKATVLPANATDKTVMWASSNKNIATVDKNGKITARKAGTAKITVTTRDGKKTATTTVTVRPVKVTGVKLNRKSITLKVRKSNTLKATVSPANATNKTVTWKSSNKKVATVNKKGKVTAKKAGTARITVTTKDGKKKAVTTVKVRK